MKHAVQNTGWGAFDQCLVREAGGLDPPIPPPYLGQMAKRTLSCSSHF